MELGLDGGTEYTIIDIRRLVNVKDTKVVVRKGRDIVVIIYCDVKEIIC